MKKAFLKRLIDDGVATIGSFSFTSEGKLHTLHSVELPWRNNQKGESCIPKGIYKVVTTFSNRFKKDMWLLLDVPGRSGVRIHSANYSRELEGCIALGFGKTDLDKDGTQDITESKKAINFAMEHLGKEFMLEIS